ncbi:MAG TPA: hypothetical protein VFC65_16980 [Prolixibacteraceae bacterium]|nr:hypothetical protein [Prolixibacteraceae bacterium]
MKVQSPASPSKGLCTINNKGTLPQSQLQTIFFYLLNHVATASMVADATGVPQKCITRYKRDLENSEMLWEIEKKDCQKARFKDWYLSMDPAMAPKIAKQFSLNLLEEVQP